MAETADWLLREMRVDGGGFASSLDADSDGGEGKYYVWTEAEIDEALSGTMIPRFKQVYDVRPEGNFEGHNILHRVVPLGSLTRADEQLLGRQREHLLAARQKRTPPERDDKVLANWNGLTIAALAFASAVFTNLDWLKAARDAFGFVVAKMGEGDRLYHSSRDGRRRHMGFADDYTNMAQAALALWEATGERAYLNQAEAWVGALNSHFWDHRKGRLSLCAQRRRQHRRDFREVRATSKFRPPTAPRLACWRGSRSPPARASTASGRMRSCRRSSATCRPTT